jgi:hypothetical protein
LSPYKLKPQHCDGITVKRLTPELLNTVPQVYGATGSLVGIEDAQYVALVTAGGLLLNAVRQSQSWTHNEAHTDNESWAGESVLEAIYRHQEESLTLIIWLEDGYNIVDHHSRAGWRITVYKPSKEFAVSDLIAQAVIRARAEVKAEAAF